MSLFPRKLPIGRTTFNAWVTDIIALSGLPDNDSVRNLAARFILALPPALGYLSIRKVSNQLIKAAANQTASEIIDETKSPPSQTQEVVVQKAKG